MCKSSKEYGGPKRCAAHAREKFSALTKEHESISIKRKAGYLLIALLKEPKLSYFGQKDKKRETITQAAQDFFNTEDERSKFLQEYDISIDKLRSIKNSSQASAYIEEHIQNGPNEFNLAELINKTNKEHTITTDNLNRAKKEYLGTDEGLLSVVLNSNNYDQHGNPFPEVTEAIDAYAWASSAREAQRRVVMEKVRLNAKFTTRDTDWAEYQKWQDAWDKDPTLLNPDRLHIQARTNNSVSLRAVQHGWLFHFTKDPETGKIKRTVDFRS